MEVTTVTQVRKNDHAKKKSENHARLLIRKMFCPPLVVPHQIDEHAIGKMISIRDGFHNMIKNMKELIMMSITIFLV